MDNPGRTKITRIHSHPEQEYQARKRLFIGLITGTSVALCLALVLFWVIPFVGLRNLHPVAPYVLGALVIVIIGLIAWSALTLVLNILLGRRLPFSKRLRGVTVKLFLPLMILFGRMLGISKELIRNSFIKVNNELVQTEAETYDPEQILLLLPHCLQSSRCKVRLTYDIHNCKRCGECPISGLLELTERYGVHVAIATGGTIARRIVVNTRPRFIMAVACERDLSEGIQDTYPIPAYGILNERPNGPCLDTMVSLEHIEQAMQKFIRRERLPVSEPDAPPKKQGSVQAKAAAE